ncbi:hypothetical protein [Cryptobacterium curtum]|uniref:hypothetical protein n=1 Tax=Cryptobacterium curtum TaxID=84163 RepID=UPI0003063866|nr:hypothetical protein [Cryptobacterium curtum]
MTKSRYSEEEVAQTTAGELLHKMGWELVYAYDNCGCVETSDPGSYIATSG